MAILTATSAAPAHDLSPDGWAPCCGAPPAVFTWSRGPGRGLIGLTCQNPRCENFGSGVLAGYPEEAPATWERWRSPDPWPGSVWVGPIDLGGA